MSGVELLDTVTPTVDRPDHDRRAGHVGTVVETLAQGVFEVEFCDDQGRTYASMAVPATQLITPRFIPTQAA